MKTQSSEEAIEKIINICKHELRFMEPRIGNEGQE